MVYQHSARRAFMAVTVILILGSLLMVLPILTVVAKIAAAS